MATASSLAGSGSRPDVIGSTMHLAGRLAAKEVPELLEACMADVPPILELDELVSVDAVGLDARLRIEERGGQLMDLPEYIRLKLNVLASERRR